MAAQNDSRSSSEARTSHGDGVEQARFWGVPDPRPRFGVHARSWVAASFRVGDFAGGRGEFFREWETPQGRSRGRITFSDVTPDSVDWELAISTDGGESWSTLWKMEMSRLED